MDGKKLRIFLRKCLNFPSLLDSIKVTRDCLKNKIQKERVDGRTNFENKI